MILFYYIYNNCKSNRDTVIVVKRVFSLAKTIVVDVIVIYIPRIPVVFFVMGHAYVLMYNMIRINLIVGFDHFSHVNQILIENR